MIALDSSAIDKYVAENPLPPLNFQPVITAKSRLGGKKGGGKLSREEVRRRAGEAMLRNLPLHVQCLNPSKVWAICGGGPSIKDHVSTIRELKRKGACIVSANKTHDWLLENDIVPWGHVLLDPGEHVADYVKRPRKDVRYFVSSQCHDKTFDSLEGYPIFLWHAGQDFEDGLPPEPNTYLKEHWMSRPWLITAGPTTVGLRAIFLGSQMGTETFHIFGLDSSRASGKMHAYDKQEADAESGAVAANYRGRKYVFDTNAHMARQQVDFDKLIEDLPRDIQPGGRLAKNFSMTVYGSGLIPFTAATMGLHADPECNADPSKVGGYVDIIGAPSVEILLGAA